jgi:hypothetical protein
LLKNTDKITTSHQELKAIFSETLSAQDNLDQVLAQLFQGEEIKKFDVLLWGIAHSQGDPRLKAEILFHNLKSEPNAISQNEELD